MTELISRLTISELSPFSPESNKVVAISSSIDYLQHHTPAADPDVGPPSQRATVALSGPSSSSRPRLPPLPLHGRRRGGGGRGRGAAAAEKEVAAAVPRRGAPVLPLVLKMILHMIKQ